MERKQGLLVIAAVAVFAVALFVAWQIGKSASEDGTVAGQPEAVKKLRAKPGTMRDNARAIVSDVPSAPSEETQPSDSAGERPAVWNPPEEVSIAEKATREVDRLVDEALHARSLSEGVARVREKLDATQAPEDRAVLYSTLGTMYGRLGELERMSESFRMAAVTSLDDAEQVEAVYRHAKMWLDNNRPKKALEVIAASHLDDAEVSARLLQTHVVEAMAYEKLGHRDDAVALYEKVIADAHAATNRYDLDAVTRQAALRASRIYRDSGDKAGLMRIQRTLSEEAVP